MILSKTTSSPEESLASNLQCETVLLNSVSAASKEIEVADMRPQTKKLCKADRAVDVMGPVDNGDLMIEKNGAKRVGNGRLSMSIHYGVGVNVSDECLSSTCHAPSTSLTVRLSS